MKNRRQIMSVLTIHNFRQRVQSNQGFSLIELLVAISIFLLLTGIGAVNYRTFNQRQELQQSVHNVQEALRFAQKKARVGEKPVGCEAPIILEGYSVQAAATGDNFEIYAECRDPGGTDVDIQVGDTQRLVGGVNFAMGSNLNVLYKGLTGGTNSAAALTITLDNNGLGYSFIVNQGGEISEGAFN